MYNNCSVLSVHVLLQDCVALPHLLVVPLSVLNNWERELAVWAPYLTVVSLKGSAAARQLLLDHCLYAAQAAGKGRGPLQVGVVVEGLWVTRRPVEPLSRCGVQPQ
jgi:hypothetical protein